MTNRAVNGTSYHGTEQLQMGSRSNVSNLVYATRKCQKCDPFSAAIVVRPMRRHTLKGGFMGGKRMI
jgi:hypothetical protein